MMTLLFLIVVISLGALAYSKSVDTAKLTREMGRAFMWAGIFGLIWTLLAWFGRAFPHFCPSL